MILYINGTAWKDNGDKISGTQMASGLRSGRLSESIFEASKSDTMASPPDIQGSGSLVQKVLQLSPTPTLPPGQADNTAMNGQNSGAKTVIDPSDPIARRSDIQELRSLIEGLTKLVNDQRAYVDLKLSEMSQNLKDHFQAKFTETNDHVEREITRVGSRIDDLETRVHQTEEATARPEFDPEVSIIASNIPVSEDEDIMEIAQTLVREGLSIPETTIPVVRAMRLPARTQGSRPNNRPPLVKIEFRSLDEKKTALKAKPKLKNSADWSNVFIRTSKPHLERVVDMNFKTMLDMMPNGRDYKITGSGKIVKKDS